MTDRSTNQAEPRPTPVQVAEKCGVKVYGWYCQLPKGHTGDHDYHAPKPERRNS